MHHQSCRRVLHGPVPQHVRCAGRCHEALPQSRSDQRSGSPTLSACQIGDPRSALLAKPVALKHPTHSPGPPPCGLFYARPQEPHHAPSNCLVSCNRPHCAHRRNGRPTPVTSKTTPYPACKPQPQHAKACMQFQINLYSSLSRLNQSDVKKHEILLIW
ncbi:hypothetical protein D3C78_56840 [compost metagenome]